MLSYDTEQRLCTLIAAIADAEPEMETYRKLLVEAQNFEPYSAFLRLDKYRLNCISALDIVDFLK